MDIAIITHSNIAHSELQSLSFWTLPDFAGQPGLPGRRGRRRQRKRRPRHAGDALPAGLWADHGEGGGVLPGDF